MCFSATASFSSAALTTAIGIATVRQVTHPRELPLAAMPLLFAFQQAIEGALWLQLPAAGSRDVITALSLTFLMFAKVLWPAYTALAVLPIEPDPRRRRALYAIAGLGCAISIYSLSWLSDALPGVCIRGHSIDYGGSENAVSVQTFVYLLCTCGPLLLSSSGAVQNFGLIVLAGFLVSAYTYFATFVSVWCFFAAAGSSLLYFHFKRAAIRAGAASGKFAPLP